MSGLPQHVPASLQHLSSTSPEKVLTGFRFNVSSSSGSTASTQPAYSPRIAEIRATTAAEKRRYGKTVYIRRYDTDVEYISSVLEFSAYSYVDDEVLWLEIGPAAFWDSYNAVANWILSGKIKLTGNKNCFQRLATPDAGVRTLDAGNGIYFVPDVDIDTFGEIRHSAPNDALTIVHLTAEKKNRRGQVTNHLKLKRRSRYLINGDDLDSNTVMPWQRHELLICDRGRMSEAGWEIPGAIGKDDFWYLDSRGKWQGALPLLGRKLCSGCLQAYRNREWPTPDVCESEGPCYNAGAHELGSGGKAGGYFPALAEYECAEFLLATCMGSKTFYPWSTIRNVTKVLDKNFVIRDWDHLSEVTGYKTGVLAVLFCSVPSLGQRLNKKGASFVPWARESGLVLGDYLRAPMAVVRALYVVMEQAVIEKCTGLKIKFREDGNGVTHVERGGEDFSEQLPVGDSGFVCLGG